MTDSTLDRLCAIIVDIIVVPVATTPPITADTRFVADLKADSLDMVQITMDAEAEWDLELNDDAAQACETVGDMVALIDAAVATQAVAA